ncbi:PREDICTED: uncharacterized protein LOC104809794 isoform X2 [Tarenaya hassleriana]|uniref:uncharacterized protein LOC104809794 isoform X2 n=1 Tax=Tarenaya hassleriana TaxID=28532 RepID=UPI0008FD567A|nr:PREDICTED: uncharacterized protein LOC104809794 isoform X2 [Tarenaya hassleriana]
MKSNPPENGPKVAGDEQYMRLTSDGPKKTRDLPNVSECRACGFRVDSCEESSKICSYCFGDASMEDCVRCCQCDRSLHSSCFQHYRTVPVCSCNSLPGKDFFICVDCWVPISIARKRPISTSRVVCQHGMSLKPLDVNRGICIDGKNVEPVILREMGLRKTIAEMNAIELDHTVLDLEKDGGDSFESGQYRNLHPEVEMDPLNQSLSAKNPEEKLIDRSETSTTRCLNVYVKNRWRSGKYLWITNDCFRKMEATAIKGQERCSTRLMNLYVRKRWRNGKVGEKQSSGFQKKGVEQEKGSKDIKGTEKQNAESHNSNSRLAEQVVLRDERQRFSVKPTKVYARVRFKSNGCTR